LGRGYRYKSKIDNLQFAHLWLQAVFSILIQTTRICISMAFLIRIESSAASEHRILENTGTRRYSMLTYHLTESKLWKLHDLLKKKNKLCKCTDVEK
jgi:hypothetical protein